MAATAQQPTHEPVEFPSASEVSEALHILDLLICAAEDSGLYASSTVAELAEAYATVDRFINHREQYA